MKAITWKAVEVLVSKIKPTPNNFKLKTEDGTHRFKTSVDTYGRAGTVILNADYTLIDGNTRVEDAKEKGDKKVWASMPSRKLTPKEFTEFAAMYDMARAGEVDILRIKEELGTSDAFFKRWGFELPKKSLAKLAELEKKEKVINPTAARHIPDAAKEIPTRQIALMFLKEQAAEYIEMGEALYKQYKVDNITDLSMALMKAAFKSRKK